jgi:hypothetical protein
MFTSPDDNWRHLHILPVTNCFVTESEDQYQSLPLDLVHSNYTLHWYYNGLPYESYSLFGLPSERFTKRLSIKNSAHTGLAYTIWYTYRLICLATAIQKQCERHVTYRWSCRLNAFPHILHTYFRSSLCVSLCLARADAFPNTFPHTCNTQTYFPSAQNHHSRSISMCVSSLGFILN